ncbi:Uncharacterized conserved protein, DUF1800 family [Spirosomataceae bacterium TFI 002]|nr:Uncharacterized conserved protein, DUF1800 family [Spirosomataceae bacterium TFI 002]
MRIPLLFSCILLNLNAFCQSPTTFGKGNIEGVSVTSSSNSTSGIETLLTTGYLPNDNAASRFLSQATFGADSTTIQQVKAIGIEPWLDQQLAMQPGFNFHQFIAQKHIEIRDSLRLKSPSATIELKDVFIGDEMFDLAWFQGAMTTPDQVRWRVSFALSEIFVTSRNSPFAENAYALGDYYDVLNEHAFGNYRSLIDSITYHPAMAIYLTYMNNHATDTTDGKQVFPDENYARELMQLFSIGLYELNIDGTEKKDVNGNSIPTYDNSDIAGLAKVFTGLSWQDSRYLGDRQTGDLRDLWYTKRLKFFPIDSSKLSRIVNGHEPGAKFFLGQMIPNRPVAQGEQDIQDALNIIFNHPNVGPFMALRLIQRLVTSNPTPAYVARVATVFNNNGYGVRGDLRAVVRAILLDNEARECCNGLEPYKGHLKEPFVRYMNLVKGLNLTSTTGRFRNRMTEVYNQTDQKPLASPSVFNFFHTDYQPDNSYTENNKYAPEFEILNSQTLTGYLNALKEWLIDNDPVDYYGIFSQETYKPEERPGFDLEKYRYLAQDKYIPELLDKFNHIFAHGSLSPKSLEIIKNSLDQMTVRKYSDGSLDQTELDRKLRIAIFLIMSSPDYLINK